MKLTVLSKRAMLWLVSGVIFTGSTIAFAQRVAPCKEPPGGQVSCEQSQMATCRIDTTGKVDGHCRNVPAHLNPVEVQAWALSQILGKEISTEDVEKPEYKNILKTGRLRSGDAVTTFSIPSMNVPSSEPKLIYPEAKPKREPPSSQVLKPQLR